MKSLKVRGKFDFLPFLPFCIGLDCFEVVQSLYCLALINNAQSLKLPKFFCFVTSCYSVKNACTALVRARQYQSND